MNRRSIRSRRIRGSVVATVMLVAALVAGCGAGRKSGLELDQLRSLAKRVEGGGVECPLAISDSLLRPSTVDADTPVLPLRIGGSGSDGVIDKGLRTRGAVEVTCRYSIGANSVTLVVAGVRQGHAITEFADRISKRGDGATALTFIDVNGDLPVGRAASLPGKPPAAFTRLKAASGDVALVLSIDRLKAGAQLPTSTEVDRKARAIARALVD